MPLTLKIGLATEYNTYANAPLPETRVPDPTTNTMDVYYVSNEAPRMEETENQVVHESPQDWNDIFGDPIMVDDYLPF